MTHEKDEVSMNEGGREGEEKQTKEKMKGKKGKKRKMKTKKTKTIRTKQQQQRNGRKNPLETSSVSLMIISALRKSLAASSSCLIWILARASFSEMTRNWGCVRKGRGDAGERGDGKRERRGERE